MAVVEVKETTGTEGVQSTETLSERTDQRKYWVRVNSITDGPLIVRNADDGSVAIPAMGAAFPGDSILHVVHKDVDRLGDYVWHVTCQYSSRTSYAGFATAGPGSGPIFVEYPPNRDSSYDWGSYTIQQTFERTFDAAPKQVTNSAGQPFDPPPMLDIEVTTLRIGRWEAITGFQMRDLMRNYNNRVNDRDFLGYPKNQAKLKITGQLRYESDGYYHWVMYEVSFLEGANFAASGNPADPPDTWSGHQLYTPDAGYGRLVQVVLSGGTILEEVQAVKDSSGDVLTAPVNLDGGGLVLPPNAPPHYLYFQRCKYANFDDLALV